MNFHFADNYIKVMLLLPDCCTWLESVHSAERGAKHRVSSLAPIFPKGKAALFKKIFLSRALIQTDDTTVCVFVVFFKDYVFKTE